MTSQQQAVKKTLWQLSGLLLAMVLFTMALVPLYDVFCEVTGLNGKARQMSLEQIRDSSLLSTHRTLEMQFVTRVGTGLPISFEAESGRQSPIFNGRNQTHFTFHNEGNKDLLIRTVPSISPAEASPHVLKIECFCFQEMVLKAGEEKEVGLMYMIGAGLPEHVADITLSYTVYPVESVNLTQEDSL